MNQSASYKSKGVSSDLLRKVIDGLLTYAEANNGSLSGLHNRDIWRLSGVFRPTYYRNFSGINDIYQRIEQEITEQLRINLTPLLSADTDAQRRILFYRVFAIIENNQRACSVALYSDSISFWRSWFLVIKPFIRSYWKYSTELSFDFFYEAYTAEMVFIIRTWAKKQYDRELINDCVSQALYFVDLYGSLQNSDMRSYLAYRPLYSDGTTNSPRPNY